MSLRGVRQLQELIIRYSDYDGSSRGIREWLRNEIVPFAAANPAISITTILKRSKHPCIWGKYVNGNVKQIDVKNKDPTVIHTQVYFLRNQIGRKVISLRYKKPVISSKPSIQGEWHERMDLIGLNFVVESKFP